MMSSRSLPSLAAPGLLALVAACGGGVDIVTGSSTTGSGSGVTTGTGMSTGTGGDGGVSTATTVTSGVGGEGTGTGGAGAGTSGVGGAGGTTEICPGFGDLCTTCLSTDCPETYCNCYNNPECLALINCFNTCAGDPGCIQKCEESAQGGISDVLLLSGCAGSICKQSCPNSEGNPPTPCETCMFTECETAANACIVQPECSALFQCLSTCPNLDLACQQGCYADHGDGTVPLQELLQCTSQLCSDKCM